MGVCFDSLSRALVVIGKIVLPLMNGSYIPVVVGVMISGVIAAIQKKRCFLLGGRLPFYTVSNRILVFFHD